MFNFLCLLLSKWIFLPKVKKIHTYRRDSGEIGKKKKTKVIIMDRSKLG